MSAKAFRWLWLDAVKAKDCPLSSTQRAVAVAHGLHAHDDGGDCWPGVYLIASETAFSVSTVERVRSELVRDGWLVCEFKGGTFKGSTRMKSEFRLRIPRHSAPLEDF